MNTEQNPRDEINKLYNSPQNRKLKIACYISIGITFLLMLGMIIFMGKLSIRALLWMRGFAGLFAIVFAVLFCILTYRVYSQFIHGHPKK